MHKEEFIVTVYRIIKGRAIFQSEECYEMVSGCSISRDSQPETVEIFGNVHEAFEALEMYYTSISKTSHHWLFEEYYIEQAKFNDDCEEIDCKVVAITYPTFIVIEKHSKQLVKEFNNLREAEIFANKLTIESENQTKEYVVTI